MKELEWNEIDWNGISNCISNAFLLGAKVIKQVSENCNDEKKKNIYLVTFWLKTKNSLNKQFLDKDICPPIYYFMNKMIDLSTEEFLNSYLDDTVNYNIYEMINSSDVKKFYLNSIESWHEEEEKNEIKEFIKNIKDNFERDNIYTTTLALFTLIEYKVRSVSDDGRIDTNKIKDILKTRCFKNDMIKSKELAEIFEKFLGDGEYNIYKTTKSGNVNYLTRHSVHGIKLELISKEKMLSLIFLTDCIFKMLYK